MHVADVALEQGELDPSTIIAGTPAVTETLVSTSPDGSVLRGIWRITEGTVTDVEEDELFVVLEGRATIEVDGGPTLEVGPGDLGVLERGARTTWTVHEPLRKVFQITLAGASGTSAAPSRLSRRDRRDRVSPARPVPRRVRRRRARAVLARPSRCPLPCPPLDGPEAADLVIVGGGFTGLWAAIQAKEEDPSRDVMLVERDTIAYGASGRNGGFCDATLTHGLENGRRGSPTRSSGSRRWAVRASGIAETIERHGIDCDWVTSGEIGVATEPHQVDWLREAVHDGGARASTACSWTGTRSGPS